MDTAEIKLNKVPDRESPFVINGTYYAMILCITDELHSQTSTGTIALQVEDLNDNCPKLVDNVQIVCSDASMVNVTAEDGDSDPNGAPLEFRLIQEKTKGKWNLQQINDVSASLLAEDDLWPGFYEVTMEIRDKQGLVCPDEQVLRLEVCTCSEGMFCGSKVAAIRTTSASFGAAGISFLILGFLCLILVPMAIIKCEFGKHFTEMPIETEQHLISYSTEGKATEMDIPQMKIPPKLNKIQLFQEPLRMVEANSNIPADEMQVPLSNHAVNNNYNIMQTSAFGGFYNDMNMVNSARWQEEQVSLDAFLKKYLEHNSMFISENDSPKEGLKYYDYEGEGSVTGSIESCSFIESNDDLEFMNNLGSKFNTLAEVCGFRQTDPKVIVNTGEITPNAAASSSHMTNIVQPSPEEIPVKSPLVHPEPNQGTVIQEPMYYVFNQPMASNVLLPENGHGQGVYIINGTPEAGRFLTQGNGHTLEHFGSGQQAVLSNNIIGDSVLYSHIGPQSPVMTTTGLGEVNPAVIQNLSPASNLVVMPQQQLDGIGSLQMLGENGQGRVNSQLLVSGPYPSASKEGGDSRLMVSGHSILEAPVSGGNLLFAGPGQYPVSMNAGTPNLMGLHQVQTGQINNSQLLVNGVQNIVSGKGGQSRQLVSGPTILEGSGQLPLAMSSGVLSPVELPQAANRQLFHSTVSRVLTSMVMMPKSKGLATNWQRNIEQ